MAMTPEKSKQKKPEPEHKVTVEYFKEDGFKPKTMTVKEVNEYIHTSKRRYRIRNWRGEIVMTKTFKG